MDIFYNTPFYGVPRLIAELKRRGFKVNHKRVRRLQKVLGLQTIYPRPHFNTSEPHYSTKFRTKFILVFAILQIEAILKQEHLHQFFYKSCPAHGGRRILSSGMHSENARIYRKKR